MATADSFPALVVQRIGPAETPNTSEIRALAETAGYRVVNTIAVAAAFVPEYVVSPERLGAIGTPVVPVSVHAESNIDALTGEICAALPERERYQLNSR